jgi:cytochrome c oxidase subunit 4
MAATQQATHKEEHSFSEHGAHDLKKYLVVFGVLCALTMCSFLTYFPFWREHVDLKAGWFLMMAVSVSKALLVMLFFMHLKYEASWKYVLTIPASVMSLFLIVMLIPDVKWRNTETAGGRVPSAERLLFQAQPRHLQPQPLSEPARGQ